MLIGTLLLIPMVFVLRLPGRRSARALAGAGIDAH
jgi:hypothetical protein